jgi:2-polyprenyl-3-methyl-5-hydroxy-6-metoxy-1,4-benzoquinol methylase
MESKLSGNELWESVMSSVSEEKLELSTYFAHQIKGNIRHVLFTLSRYKFAARMIGESPRKTVLELGCNEGIGTLNFSQIALNTTAVDFDKRAVEWANKNLACENLKFICDDFLGKCYGKFDAVVSLDVIEHIEKEKETLYLQTIVDNLNDDGFAIIGTPNITASQYASKASKIGHINLYDHDRLRLLLLKGFKNVFMFSMNDEVLHTGFYPMAHYIIALGIGKNKDFI